MKPWEPKKLSGLIFLPEDDETAERTTHAFYALWDILKKLADDLERIAEDSRVVDVIRAIRED